MVMIPGLGSFHAALIIEEKGGYVVTIDGFGCVTTTAKDRVVDRSQKQPKRSDYTSEEAYVTDLFTFNQNWIQQRTHLIGIAHLHERKQCAEAIKDLLDLMKLEWEDMEQVKSARALLARLQEGGAK